MIGAVMDQLKTNPLYLQARDRLLLQIRDGVFQPGQQLPSEADLAAQLGISRPTLREALRGLEEDGHIVRRHGLGTFVSKTRPLEGGLERLESVLVLASKQEMKTSVQDLCAEQVEADVALAERLQVAQGSPLTRVSRTILVEGEPIAYLEDYVLITYLVPADVDASFSGSVLDTLRQRSDIRVQKALAEITATAANRIFASRLGVSPGAPLLLIEETLVSAADAPVDFSRNYFLPGRLQFRIVRT